MECPNCHAPVAPGVNYCTNCGTMLSQVSAQPSFTMPTQNNENLDKYYDAYFHGKYDSVAKSGFSIGTFFFGPIWLLASGLFKEAGSYFVIALLIGFATGFVQTLLPPLRPICSIVNMVAGLALAIHYAKEFPNYKLVKADIKINNIIRSTPDENERINRCRAAGNGNSAIVIIVVIISLAFIGLIVTGILGSISATSRTYDNSRKNTFVSTAKEYSNNLRNLAYNDELICNGKSINDLGPGIYYYSFTTKTGRSAADLIVPIRRSPWNNSDVAGQFYMVKYNQKNTSIIQNFGVMVDSQGNGFGTFSSNGQVQTAYDIITLTRDKVDSKKDDNKIKFYNIINKGDLVPSLDITDGTKKLSDYIPGGKVTKPIKCVYKGN